MQSVYCDIEPGLRARVPVTRLTHSPNKCVHSYYTMPVESHDGRKIVFFEFDRPHVDRRDPETLTGHLTISNADGSGKQHVAAMKGSPAQGATAQWVGTTRRVAAVAQGGGRLIVDTETGQEWRGIESLRDVSPDGRYILCQTPENIHLVAEEEGKTLAPNEVAMVGMNYETGSIDVRISLADVLRVHPEADQVLRQHMCFKQTLFSPNGTHLSFVLSNAWYINYHRDEVKRHELFIANRNGESLRYLGPFGTHPGWAPDGNHLLAVADDASNTRRFMLYPAEGGTPLPLGKDWPGGGHPSIQPVHQRYLCSDEFDSEKGVVTLKLFDLKTSVVQDILQAEYEDYSNESGTHLHPAWTRDGRSLHISSEHLGHGQIYRVDIA